ncbi:unnamed protein product [Absidia cylindrospora]
MLSPTFDLAQHPTGDTIRLLASLLERMTTANDQLNKSALTRKGANDMHRSSSASPLGSYPPPPSSPIPTQSKTTTLATITNSSSSNSKNDNGSNSTYTLFHARSIPFIDIYSYLSRILKYCPCANECFLSLLVYFDRMSKNALAITGQPFTIDSFNIHRLIISGVMVSSKFFSDIFYTNTRYAKVGGLPVSELNRLELEFLQLNGYNVLVSISELQRYGDQLLKVGLMEQEMRMLYDSSPSSYTIRHGRSTSLGSTGLVRTLDGFDGYKQRKSMDQQCMQQLAVGTMKLQLDDNSHSNNNNNTKRHSLSSFNKQQIQPYQGNFINKDMCVYATYTSPLPPSSSSSSPAATQTNHKISTSGPSTNMRRMGSMGSLHSYHQSPLATATTEESIITQQQQMVPPPTTVASPPLFVRQHSRYDGHQQQNRQQQQQQRYSFADWPTTCASSSSSLSPSTSSVTTCSTSPPKTRQRHESMGLNGNTKIHDTTDGWRAPRQTRSSINLYQQNNSIWATTNKPVPSVTTPMVSADSTATGHQHQYQHKYQYQYPQQQQQFGYYYHPPHHHHPQQQQPFQLGHYQYPANSGRRLSLTSVHAPPFIPQRPASADYMSVNGNATTGSSSFGYYPVASTGYGIPTPPPSSSPIHHYHKPDLSYPYLSSSSSHHLYL